MDFSGWVDGMQVSIGKFLDPSKLSPELASELAKLAPLTPVIVTVIVGVLCLIYFVLYFIPSFLLSWRLYLLTRKLIAIGEQVPAERRALLDERFKGNSLEHAWKEYSETLHNQYEIHEGEKKLVRSRATVGASHFFSDQAVIETPLITEFFKHLPGILTGIGIVGTFFGLMLGLLQFDPSTPDTVNNSVAQLLHDVFLAFLGSFVAIAASIIVTLTEKWRLGRCYKRLEVLTESIDRLFDSGVGEEYLAQLVKSSNESSVQTRQLKDSLVTDLREMMQNLVDSQVRENLKLTESLAGAIESSLKPPMLAIAGAMEKASGDQTGQVGNLLQDVMVAFMSKLDSTFGQQFKGLHDMMGQSVTAMQDMQQGFTSLLQDMRSTSETSSQSSANLVAQMIKDMQAGQNSMQAGMNEMLSNLQTSIARIGSEGEGAGARMAEQLEKLFSESESRQKAMADSLQGFVEAIKQNVEQGQRETMGSISESVKALSEQLGAMFTSLEQGRENIDRVTKLSQVELHKGTRDLVGNLDGQVRLLLESVVDQQNASKEMVRSMGTQTEQHLQSMQSGAEKMRAAAERFESAGNSITKATEATVSIMIAVQGVTTDLAGASHEITSVVADYRNNREALNKTLATIESVVASAQSDAATRNQFIQDLKRQSEHMQAFNQEVNEYLEKTSEILSTGFNEFSDGMDRSLRQTLGSLDNELHKVVTSLAGGIDGVRESLDDFSEIIDKARR